MHFCVKTMSFGPLLISYPVQAGVFYEVPSALCCLTFGPFVIDGNHSDKVQSIFCTEKATLSAHFVTILHMKEFSWAS